MHDIDFTTALGRLLTDAALRERFSKDAGTVALQLGVSDADYTAFTRLAPSDIEAQAKVLLRKRLRAAAALMPATIALLGTDAPKLFMEHARTSWPRSAMLDAHSFSRWLRVRGYELREREDYRARFSVLRGGMALNLVRLRPSGGIALQILVRHERGIREWLLRFGW